MARMKCPLLLLLAGAALGCGARTPLWPAEDAAAPPDLPAPIDLPLPPDLPPPPPDLPPPPPDLPPPPPDVTLPPDAAACTPATFTLRSRPTEIAFVVDRSGSFRDLWMAVGDAFAAALPALQADVATGLLLYPERDCDVSPTLHVPLRPRNADAIVAALRATTALGRTPTRLALRAATQSLRARATGAAGYIMLVTDGVPTCPAAGDGGDRDVAGTVAAASESAAAGVPVFVVGVGVSDAAALDAVAVAGGRPTRDTEGRRFYAADSAGLGLLSALRSIQTTVTRCELPVTAPPDGASLRVEFRGEVIPEDPTQRDGWWWTDPRRAGITLHGAACSRVAMEVGDLTARVVCPGP